jgi:hypothetical protein
MTAENNAKLERVLEQLRLYEHPLFEFTASAKGEGVEVQIHAKGAAQAAEANSQSGLHNYAFELHARDLDHPQFEWQFQRQLYDALHDYLIEMFVRTPQDRADRRERGL